MSFLPQKRKVALLVAFFGFLSGTYAGTSQSINMPQYPQFTDWRAYGDAPFDLTASATSGLPVTFTSSNTNVATISGNRVTVRGVGQTTITASQAGNATYDPAAPVSRTLWVNKADQVINFSPISTKTFGDAPFNLTATGGGSGNPIVFASLNTNVATISGNTVTIVGGGYARITYSQAGNDNYEATGPTEYGFTVQVANQVVSFPNLPTKKVGDSPFSAGASVTFGLPLNYSSSNTNVATVSSSGLITIVGAGSAMITASNPGNSNFNSYMTGQQLIVEQGFSSVDGATVSLDFQVSDLTVPLSTADGWSSNDQTFRPDGYANDSLNAGNLLGYVGGFVNAPANETTQLTYNFNPGSSDRFVFQWNQNIAKSSNDFPGDDVFGWKFLSGSNAAFSVRFLNDNSAGRDLLVQGYDGAGNALTLGSGQPNNWFIDRNDANDFRVTADLSTKKWALDVFNRSNNTWYGLVLNAAIDPSFTSLNGMAATWTVADNTPDASGQYLGAGDNIMSFDNVTIQGKQTVGISLNIPTNAVYNGSAQTASASTTPSGLAVVLRYNGSTNAPVNAGTYTVTAEVADTTAYYSAPTSGSLVVAKATPTIDSAPTASDINSGQALGASTLSGGSATGVGGASLDGSFDFTYPSTVPPAGTANYSVTFTPSGAGASNYLSVMVNVSVTVNNTTTPAEDYLSSFGLTGADAALSADPDHDGLTNATEFAFGTDPTDGSSQPIQVVGDKLLFFKRAGGATYVIKHTTDLATSWTVWNTPPTLSNPQPSGRLAEYLQYEIIMDTSIDRDFYKVEATIP
ncbi:MAG: hypothetical protein EBV83_03475 [Verrucomicrobia bacterium]|nr:hypothetical protein [Verrucomicrobiota bacterium]